MNLIITTNNKTAESVQGRKKKNNNTTHTRILAHREHAPHETEGQGLAARYRETRLKVGGANCSC